MRPAVRTLHRLDSQQNVTAGDNARDGARNSTGADALRQALAQPIHGWIKTVRTGMGMTLMQLAGRLEVSTPAVYKPEQMELDDKLTVAKLRKIAQAMECDLVYGFVPKGFSTFEDALTERAHKRGGNSDTPLSARNDLWA